MFGRRASVGADRGERGSAVEQGKGTLRLAAGSSHRRDGTGQAVARPYGAATVSLPEARRAVRNPQATPHHPLREGDGGAAEREKRVSGDTAVDLARLPRKAGTGEAAAKAGTLPLLRRTLLGRGDEGDPGGTAVHRDGRERARHRGHPAPGGGNTGDGSGDAAKNNPGKYTERLFQRIKVVP